MKTVLILGYGRDALRQRAVLATLPNDFRAVNAGSADVVLVSGRDGTADAALDQAGVNALLVTSPSFLSAANRTALAAVGVPVTIALAYDPSLIPACLAGGEEPAILDLTATVRNGDPGDLRETLLAQVALARALLGDIVGITCLHATPGSIVLEAEAPSGLRWRMTAQAGLRNTLAIDRVSRAARARIVVDLDPHGRPAAVETFDTAGSHIAWPVYQSGDRSAWSALGGAGGYDLAMLERDLALLPPAA